MSSSKEQPTRPVLTSDFEEPADRRFREALRLALPIELLAGVLSKQIAAPWLSSRKTAKAVRAGRNQLPELWRLGERAAELFTIEPPEIFVIRSGGMEMILLGQDQSHVIVVPSLLTDLCTPDEICFLLAREMGRIACGHGQYLTLYRWIWEGLGSTIRKFAMPGFVLFRSWQRCAVSTADKAGLLACQDLRLACEVLLLQTVGSRDLCRGIDVEHYARAGLRELLAHPVRLFPELLECEPVLPRRIARLYDFWSGEVFQEIFPGLGGEAA